MSVVIRRRVEGVVDNPNLSAWPDLFGFCGVLVIWAFVCCCVVTYAARHLINALRYPEVITPTHLHTMLKLMARLSLVIRL